MKIVQKLLFIISLLSATIPCSRALEAMEKGGKQLSILTFLKEDGEKKYKKHHELTEKRELAKTGYKKRLLSKKRAEHAAKLQKKQIHNAVGGWLNNLVIKKQQIHDAVKGWLDNVNIVQSCPICAEPLLDLHAVVMHPNEVGRAKQHRVHGACLYRWLARSGRATRYAFFPKATAAETCEEFCVVCKKAGKVSNGDMHQGALEVVKGQPLKKVLADKLFVCDHVQQMNFPELAKIIILCRDLSKMMLVFERIDGTSPTELAKELNGDCTELLEHLLSRFLQLYQEVQISAQLNANFEVSAVKHLDEVAQDIVRIFFDRVGPQSMSRTLVFGLLSLSKDKSLQAKVVTSLRKLSEDSLEKLLEEKGALELKDFAEDIDLCVQTTGYTFSQDFDGSEAHSKKIIELLPSVSKDADPIILAYMSLGSAYTFWNAYWSKLPAERQIALSIAACTSSSIILNVSTDADSLVGITYENLPAEDHKRYLEQLAKALLAYYDKRDEPFYRLCGRIEQAFLFLGATTLEVEIEADMYWRALLLQAGLDEKQLLESIVKPAGGRALATVFNRGIFEKTVLKDVLLVQRDLWSDELWEDIVKKGTVFFVAEEKKKEFMELFAV